MPGFMFVWIMHETTLDVNFEAIAENLNFYRSFMKPETKITCMVKASAYGAGSVEIAKTLQDRGVDYLAVAVADEGADLRRAGITTGIIVMNPEMTAFNTLFQYDLEPEVYSFKLLDALVHAAEKQGIQGFPVHIKLDTGMHRLAQYPVARMSPTKRACSSVTESGILFSPVVAYGTLTYSVCPPSMRHPKAQPPCSDVQLFT